MDLHQLEAFIAVSREGSVTRAAERMRLTPSPVSRLIRELERETGTLFERNYHSTRLTVIGERLLPAAVAIVQQTADLLPITKGEPPEIRYAATPWAPARFTKQLRDAVTTTSPGVEEPGAVSAELLHALRHGALDLALVHLPVALPGVDSARLAGYEFRLVVTNDDPLAHRAAASGADLAGREVLMLPSAMQPSAMARLRDWLQDQQVDCVTEVTLADVPLLSARLRRAGAVTLAASDEDVPVHWSADVTVVPLSTDGLEFDIGFAWRTVDPFRSALITEVVAVMQHGSRHRPAVSLAASPPGHSRASA